MNNGAYTLQDPEKLGAKVEELVRQDLALETPVPFQVESAGAKTGVGSFLSDAATHIFGGSEAAICKINFDLQQPRPFKLSVHVNRQGLGSHLASVIFQTKLAKPVTGEVSLEQPKTFGSSKFVGDEAVAAKLNANKDLIKRANKFPRTEFPAVHLKGPRLFQIVPQDGAAVLVAATYPRSHAMGFKVSLDVPEFVELAGLIEATL